MLADVSSVVVADILLYPGTLLAASCWKSSFWPRSIACALLIKIEAKRHLKTEIVSIFEGGKPVLSVICVI